jgi:hypothetical protein
MPGNYIGRYRYRNRWRTFGNKYFWIGLSILGSYIALGLIFLFSSNHLLTSILTPSQEAIMNVIIDSVIAFYIILLVSLKFFTSKLAVYTEALTEEHYIPLTSEISEGAEKAPLYPVVKGAPTPVDVSSRPVVKQLTPKRRIGRIQLS